MKNIFVLFLMISYPVPDADSFSAQITDKILAHYHSKQTKVDSQRKENIGKGDVLRKENLEEIKMM